LFGERVLSRQFTARPPSGALQVFKYAKSTIPSTRRMTEVGDPNGVDGESTKESCIGEAMIAVDARAIDRSLISLNNNADRF
jgi:hypothetical protein